MSHRTIFLPEGVVRTLSKDARRTRFANAETVQRLEFEQAYRDEQSILLSSRQLKQRKKRFETTAQDTESQLQLVAMILQQLARQENIALSQLTADGGMERNERDAMRSETMEILRTIL